MAKYLTANEARKIANDVNVLDIPNPELDELMKRIAKASKNKQTSIRETYISDLTRKQLIKLGYKIGRRDPDDGPNRPGTFPISWNKNVDDEDYED